MTQSGLWAGAAMVLISNQADRDTYQGDDRQCGGRRAIPLASTGIIISQNLSARTSCDVADAGPVRRPSVRWPDRFLPGHTDPDSPVAGRA